MARVVVVVNTKKLRAISEARAKTDRLDARRRAELLASGYLTEVWCPDERTRALRRWVATTLGGWLSPSVRDEPRGPVRCPPPTTSGTNGVRAS